MIVTPHSNAGRAMHLVLLSLLLSLSLTEGECNESVLLPAPDNETEFAGELCGTEYGTAFLDTVRVDLSIDRRYRVSFRAETAVPGVYGAYVQDVARPDPCRLALSVAGFKPLVLYGATYLEAGDWSLRLILVRPLNEVREVRVDVGCTEDSTETGVRSWSCLKSVY